MAHTDVSPVILWFREDLRLQDHPGVAAALACGRPILPLYIWDESAATRPVGAAARWWLRRSLEALDEDLRKSASRLIFVRGHAAIVLSHLSNEYNVKTIFCGQNYDPKTEDSDINTLEHLSDQHIELKIVNSTLLAPANSLKTKSDQPYRVFTPFGRAMIDRGFASVDKMPANTGKIWPKPAHWPDSLTLDDLPFGDTRTQSGANWAAGFDVFTPGERGARQALDRFIAHGLHDYAYGRDWPDRQATSGLSPHLRFGEISPRRILHDIDDAARRDPRLGEGAAKFRVELLWREFCYGLLVQQPRLHTVNFRRDFNSFPWLEDDRGFRAWTRGETGYPLVDAGMRQLWQTGWMHNRVRMVVASFLVKHLLIDWRRGEQWFWDCLVDADPANNPANWQWVAGCGADAAPYFRIFNPTTQAEKFDPDGTYRAEFITGFAPAGRKGQRDLFDMAGARAANATYPAPIIDHDFARKRALAAFQEMRNDREDDHDDPD